MRENSWKEEESDVLQNMRRIQTAKDEIAWVIGVYHKMQRLKAKNRFKPEESEVEEGCQ